MKVLNRPSAFAQHSGRSGSQRIHPVPGPKVGEACGSAHNVSCTLVDGGNDPVLCESIAGFGEKCGR